MRDQEQQGCFIFRGRARLPPGQSASGENLSAIERFASLLSQRHPSVALGPVSFRSGKEPAHSSPGNQIPAEPHCRRLCLLWACRARKAPGEGSPDGVCALLDEWTRDCGWNESKILLDQFASMTENGLVVVDGPGRRRSQDHLRKFLAMLVQVTDRPCESGDVIRGSQPSPVVARDQIAGIRALVPHDGSTADQRFNQCTWRLGNLMTKHQNVHVFEKLENITPATKIRTNPYSRFGPARADRGSRGIRDQARNPPKYTEKRIRINFPFPCPSRGRLPPVERFRLTGRMDGL